MRLDQGKNETQVREDEDGKSVVKEEEEESISYSFSLFLSLVGMIQLHGKNSDSD